jgi:Macrocin-O-methyltransferase (TylF)
MAPHCYRQLPIEDSDHLVGAPFEQDVDGLASWVAPADHDHTLAHVLGCARSAPPLDGGLPLAVLRLDGDMCESTIEALASLCPKLSAGGRLIVDDYGNQNTPGCRTGSMDSRETAH